MSIERTFHCDAPGGTLPGTEADDRCPGHASTASDPPHVPYGFLVVFESWPGGSRELHFCTWDCLLRFSAKQEPPTFIGVDDE